MKTYRIIGIMTGNSMDAIDLVLSEFNGAQIKDICAFSKPFSKKMQQKMANLRSKVNNKTKAEILRLPEFKSIHDEYVKSVADAVLEMCAFYHLDKAGIDAIGFHGKTLDHNPPSKAFKEGSKPYTLQIGSGKMLADLTGIKVVYDFRSAFILQGFEGAPLIAPHNARIALIEGDGIYYNAGNTSNFALIKNAQALLSADAGPCNEYIDSFIRKKTDDSCDFDAKYGKNGKLDKKLLVRLFELDRAYYEAGLPKSGDPQYYHLSDVLEAIEQSDACFEDAVFTLEYLAAYTAAFALTLIESRFDLPSNIVLFGGGWKNPIVRESFENLLAFQGYVLPEHQSRFEVLRRRLKQRPAIKYSAFGQMMEARLMADMAYFKLMGMPWKLPEVKTIIAGRIAEPQSGAYDDMLSLAAKN